MHFCTLSAIMILSVFATPSLVAQGQPTGSSKMVLEEGTPLKLRLNRNLSSADAKAGEQVDFEVLEEVKVADLTVIAKGGMAMGTVTEAEPKRRMGRGGKLNVTIDYVRLADGEKAALRAVKEVKGGGHAGAMTAGIVATSLIVWPAAPFFLFMHGKDITIPKGTEITAYVNGNMELARAKFLPAGAAAATAEPGAAKLPEGAAATNSVLVSSTPPGADIEWNSAFVGSTPSLINLPPGDHLIVLKKKGFKPWERKVRVTSGSIKIEAELEPN